MRSNNWKDEALTGLKVVQRHGEAVSRRSTINHGAIPTTPDYSTKLTPEDIYSAMEDFIRITTELKQRYGVTGSSLYQYMAEDRIAPCGNHIGIFNLDSNGIKKKQCTLCSGEKLEKPANGKDKKESK